MEINLDLPKPYTPHTKDLLDFSQTCGLVEEKENFILLALSAINKVSCGVESVSGSGKSVLTDILMDLIPKHRIYNLGLTSNTATMYDYKALNEADIVYIEELQKAMSSSNPIVVELLKNMTEGKELTRKVYDAVSKEVIQHKIKGNLGVVYSLALENKQKKDEELHRRVVTFMTDISQDQNRRVVKYIGKTRFNKKRLKIQTTETTKNLKEHINIVMDLANKGVENPFAEYISEHVPVPFTIVRSYMGHYFNLVDGSTKFHFKERIKKDEVFFSTIQDIFNIHTLYGRIFNQKIHQLPQLGKEIMDIFEDKTKGWKKNEEKQQQQLFTEEDDLDKRYLDISQVHKALKAKGILLKHKVISDQCDLLIEAGFLGKEASGRKNLYYKTDEVEEFESNFNYTECFEIAYKNMQEQFPELAEEWKNSQVNKDGYISVNHPLTRDELIIVSLDNEEEVKDEI
jgi:hypothetical protein|tara:strand:+ start:335 stop:1708 length:1374 start_codon:yes stop_codon:yes gene_type:complete